MTARTPIMSNEDGAISNAATDVSDDDTLVLYGSSFVDRMTFVSRTSSALVMCVGKMVRDDSEILVPLVEVKFEGPTGMDQSASKILFSELMPLENVAYILEDVSSDLITICAHLKAAGSGQLKPDPKKLSETKRYLADAKGNLERCLADLENVG
jgi:hypothetical protein